MEVIGLNTELNWTRSTLRASCDVLYLIDINYRFLILVLTTKVIGYNSLFAQDVQRAKGLG